MLVRSALFWDITRCRMVFTDVSGQRVGTIFKSQKMGPIYCTETSVNTTRRRVMSQKSADLTSQWVRLTSCRVVDLKQSEDTDY
jgi:hypothetical protein